MFGTGVGTPITRTAAQPWVAGLVGPSVIWTPHRRVHLGVAVDDHEGARGLQQLAGDEQVQPAGQGVQAEHRAPAGQFGPLRASSGRARANRGTPSPRQKKAPGNARRG